MPRSRSPVRPRASAQEACESLERRVLMASASFDAAAGVLSIAGTDAYDLVIVSVAGPGGNIIVADQKGLVPILEFANERPAGPFRYPTTQNTSAIKASLAGGDDQFILDARRLAGIRTDIFGDAGDDALTVFTPEVTRAVKGAGPGAGPAPAPAVPAAEVDFRGGEGTADILHLVASDGDESLRVTNSPAAKQAATATQSQDFHLAIADGSQQLRFHATTEIETGLDIHTQGGDDAIDADLRNLTPDVPILGLIDAGIGTDEYRIYAEPGKRSIWGLGGNLNLIDVVDAIGPVLSGGTSNIDVGALLAQLLPLIGKLQAGQVVGIESPPNAPSPAFDTADVRLNLTAADSVSAELKIELGPGADKANVAVFSSAAETNLKLLIDGGGGADVVTAAAVITPRAAQQGPPIPARGVVDIRLLGSGGDDVLSLFVDVPPNSPVSLSLLIDGGDGIDACLAPTNAKVLNCEDPAAGQ